MKSRVVGAIVTSVRSSRLVAPAVDIAHVAGPVFAGTLSSYLWAAAPLLGAAGMLVTRVGSTASGSTPDRRAESSKTVLLPIVPTSALIAAIDVLPPAPPTWFHVPRVPVPTK